VIGLSINIFKRSKRRYIKRLQAVRSMRWKYNHDYSFLTAEVIEDDKCETHDCPRGGGLEIPKIASCVRRISADKPTITCQKAECSSKNSSFIVILKNRNSRKFLFSVLRLYIFMVISQPPILGISRGFRTSPQSRLWDVMRCNGRIAKHFIIL
jgi:hypothetical protein